MFIRLFTTAYLSILVAIIIGQLIWIPAPLFNESNWEWIAIIDYLYYGLLIIPLLFIVSTIIVLKKYWNDNKKSKKWIIILASLTIVISLYMCDRVVQMDWLQAIVCLVVLCIVVFILILYLCLIYEKKTIKSMLKYILPYILVVIVLVCPIPYNVTHPFFTFNVDHYAKVLNSEIDLSDKQGSIEGVLVADRPAFIADVLYSKLFKHIDLEKRQKTDLSINEQYKQVVSQKINSNRVAEAYAWQKATGQQAIKPVGVRIVSVIANSAADNKVQAGSIIKSIDDDIINTLDDLSSKMQTVQVGQTINLHLLNINGEQQIVQLVPKAAADDPNKAVLGIYIEQAVEIDNALEVMYTSHLAHFGGPSHGAMLTLSFLNQLQGGQLIGDLHIAGTGTIELDGSIGMVGGVKQKAYAVSRTKADVFFVPEPAYEQAKLGAPNLNIVSVTHIDDILRWLAGETGKTTY